MSFSRPIQWYQSHVDPIWPDGTFNFEDVTSGMIATGSIILPFDGVLNFHKRVFLLIEFYLGPLIKAHTRCCPVPWDLRDSFYPGHAMKSMQKKNEKTKTKAN
jgi:hypothetical protein